LINAEQERRVTQHHDNTNVDQARRLEQQRREDAALDRRMEVLMAVRFGVGPKNSRFLTEVKVDDLRNPERLRLMYEATLREHGQRSRKSGRRRKNSRFLETEVRRAIRAARREGADRVEVDPTTGRITVGLMKPAESNGPNSWDEVFEDAPHPKRPS
jgi:hypothetical protein